jgi:hypothetical protein
MARRVELKNGKIAIEFNTQELAEKVLGLSVAQLEEWGEMFPKPAAGKYLIKSEQDLNKFKDRAALLNTGMTVTAVKNVESEKLLRSYARLAEDCPEGITAHVWRSYGLIVLMQVRYGKMIDAEELATRAKINKIVDGKPVADVAMAEKHIRLLTGIGVLSRDSGEEWQGQWRHQGLPKAWVKQD